MDDDPASVLEADALGSCEVVQAECEGAKEIDGREGNDNQESATTAADSKEGEVPSTGQNSVEATNDSPPSTPPSTSTALPPIPDNHDTTAVIAAIATLLAAISDQGHETERMYYFLARSFHMAQWSPETNIGACVLLLRWVQAGHVLNSSNWKKMLLVALLIAQKIADDIPLANREFCTIWQAVSEEPELLTPQQINQLEVSFLLDMEYHAFVDSATMIEIYHELVNLAANEM